MEEEIKLLEERVTTLKRHIKNYEESDCKTNVYQQLVKECNALETLLKRYKELEEENEISEEEKQVLEAFRKYKEVSGSNSWVICNPSTMWSEHFIPISVIQNKLEQNKAKTDCRYCNNACDSYAVCTVLKEILEKGNK